MASGSRTTNTFVEEVAKLMGTIANMKLTPDADLPWLIDIETKVIERVRAGESKMQQQGQIPMPQMNPQGNAAMGLPGLGGIGLPPMPPTGAGGMPPMPGMAPPSSMMGMGGAGAGMPMPGPPMPQSSAEVMSIPGLM